MISKKGVEIIFRDYWKDKGIKDPQERDAIRELIEALQMFGIEEEDLRTVLDHYGSATTAAVIYGYVLIMSGSDEISCHIKA